jgi:hypothetical protein
VIAQFVFLGIYLMQKIKKYWLISLVVFLIITGIVLKNNFLNGTFMNTHYSSYDEYYRLAIYAKSSCRDVNILVDSGSRETHDTLKKMNLLIGTSEWWGNHPSIVYYSDKKVNFFYEVPQFDYSLRKSNYGECFDISKNDLSLFPQIKMVKPDNQFSDQYLFIIK